uniref:Uncharacterized protein n=1 Tax=Biomphalaria glabrata TaxID=6526 RepID=A0A2C9L105_BIOGL
MKPRKTLEPLSERTNTKRDNYADIIKPTRAISPAFRPGPRQKRRDSNADEVIRFVREFQRHDITYQSPAELKKRSVLPAIGIHGSGDVCEKNESVRAAEDKFDDSARSSNLPETFAGHKFVLTVDAEKNSGDENSRPHYNDASAFHLKIPQSYKTDLDLDVEDTESSSRNLISSDNEIHFSPTRSNIIVSNICDIRQKHSPMSSGSSEASKVAQLMQPRPFRQLPPISRNTFQEKPLASLPSSPGSSIDEEENYP